ncbi:hypothetical protein [Ramlibacter sp.]|jgi:hypothetical protein|uniref:hypothetical protein n=1 Tax=Ramlibacter sp. TaxID=1917967 RepID=UPI002FCCA0C0|nr:hypothetical protein [Ramlibacter sp.]MCE3270140.1 hypothetical protein [Ramlibacter sp.]
MSSSNETSSDHSVQEQQGTGQEQAHAGNSGEGAASALAHLKTQTKQHRRQLGDAEDPSGGSSQ